MLCAQSCPTLCGPMDCSLSGSSSFTRTNFTSVVWLDSDSLGDVGFRSGTYRWQGRASWREEKRYRTLGTQNLATEKKVLRGDGGGEAQCGEAKVVFFFVFFFFLVKDVRVCVCVCVWVVQSCPTLCDPMNCSLPGSSVHGILQAKVLEWVATAFSRESSRTRDWAQVSHIAERFFTIWTMW